MLTGSRLFVVGAMTLMLGSCDSPTVESAAASHGGSRLATAVSPPAVTLAASAGAITACVARQSGILRIPWEGASCRDNETSIVLGGGLSGYEIVSADRMFGNTGWESGSVAVSCSDGKRVLGGGAAALIMTSRGLSVGSAGNLSFAHGSYPASENTWAVGYEKTGSVEGMRLFAICAH